CVNIRSCGVVSLPSLVAILIGDDMLAGEVSPSFIGHARVLQIRDRLAKVRLRLTEARPGLRQVCAGLLQLVIDFGRVNLSQQLPSLYAIADVRVPAAQVTVRPS